MADEKKQVTITFGGYDNNTEDSTIMFEGPLNVAAVLNTVDDVFTFNVLPYQDSELPLVVFVRNVNDQARVLSGEVPYRGSFYMYNWQTSTWQQVALGNHSHKNMEILDQLGEVDTSSMEIGDRKVLTIEKIDPDNEGNIRTYEYKISFDTLRELPEVPEYGTGKNLYLTTDSHGKFQWANSFAPAQTFKMLKIIVNSDFINGTESKVLHLSREYLDANSATYNPDLNDELLVFDSGDLLTDIDITQDDVGGIYLTITNTKASSIFETGENVVILIIRSGIAGLIDTIKEQYITKAEAIDLLTYGTINLNQYITKYDLERYAAQRKHAHSEYIRRDEFDVFDYRYADYQHIHSQYITKAQVLSILLDSVSDEGDIDIDGVVQSLVLELESRLDTTLEDIMTRAQVESFVTNQINNVKNTDAITNTITGGTLTDYLMYLASKEPEINHLDANVVELNVMQVNIGDADGIGGYKNGDIIEKGTNVNEFVRKLITKDVPPTLKEPELTVNYSLSGQDAGSTVNLYISAIFDQNDAGNLTDISYKLYKTPEEKETTESIQLTMTQGEYSITLPIVMNAIDISGLCYNLEVVATYNEGVEHHSNADNTRAYKVEAGSIVKTIQIYNKRLAYIGALTREVTDAMPILVDDLYSSVYVSQNSLFTKYDLEEAALKKELYYNVPNNKGIRTIVFAIPESKLSLIKNIIFVNQNYDITQDLSTTRLRLKDSGGLNELNKIDNNYVIYYLSLEKAVQSGLTFKIEFESE